ncbi:Hypothetical Protein FCC1311_076482 [Hondaea fermentalgiana]|uniref:Uncharacterized protein n=1 Tax=Hondaea fermentalgiana TaxID=2315210 RepID=A0A2R5GU55_9STRA|nr:Hypothetical Protein FCC1311_076482 [Hondaea fermentalgiana]|eukprot:GBG31424.1 Hypothetical Protein FCC1311_076482 [Hondaea fermentalgiana]
MMDDVAVAEEKKQRAALLREITKTGGQTPRTLARMRSELATGLLDTGVLHPRLGQLLGEFMQRKNLDLLLCRIADDFATKSRYGTPARTMESDARLLHHRKRYAHTPRRWQLPVADPHEALHDVLLPYYQFPLIDVSVKGQFLLCGFWRTMLALNGAYWAFSHTLRKACLRDLRVRGDEVLRVLSSKANAFASPVLVIEAASDPLIRVHAPSELCMQCDAFFPSKLQSRCERCGTARVILEPKRRDRASPRGNPDEESQRSIAWPAQRASRLQDLHASFFRHLEGSQDRLLRRWLEVSPERFMLATPEAVRDHLDHESEWWAATQSSVAQDLAACAGAPRQRAPLEPRAGAPQGSSGSRAKRDTPAADVFVGHAISVPAAAAGLSSPP